MKTIRPDYTHSIVNIPNSVLKYFKAPYFHNGIKELDTILNQYKPKHIVLIIFDGMGYDNLSDHLPKDSFLRTHTISKISSVYPPTTVAATTSLQSGLTPLEHGWLGWDMYFPSIDDTITVFLNKGKITYKDSIAKQLLPYTNIYQHLPNTTHVAGYGVSPFEKDPYDFKDPDQMYRMIQTLCEKDETNYIYAYYDHPDALMHYTGTQSIPVKNAIININQKVEKLCSTLKDTVVIVSADHGHIDVNNLYLEDYPELASMLVRTPSLEPRFVNFYVKPEYLDIFPSTFNKYLGKQFMLLTKAEVLDQALLGIGIKHPTVDDTLGDYMAIAIDTYLLLENRQQFPFKGHHAGMSKTEMSVPLIVIPCP